MTKTARGKDKAVAQAQAKTQLGNIVESNAAGGKVVSAMRLKGDQADYIKREISRLNDAKACIKRVITKLTGDGYPAHKSDTYLIKKAADVDADLDELVDLMRGKFAQAAKDSK